jgi:CDP-glucose 4,6-dehydratase
MNRDLESAFRSRAVLVTGHTGFKGSWLTLWLHLLGARVSGYALEPPTEPSHFVVSGVRDLLAHETLADIRSPDVLQAALEESQADVVFHLAAQALVRPSYDAPRETFEINTIGTACLLDAVRRARRPCVVVVVTSDKCYENQEQVWGYREVDPLGGHDPYSASKGATEILVSSYRRSFFPPERVREHGVKLASARAGNVVGGGDWARDRIGADVARHLALGRPVPVRHPGAVRPWQHVLEPLSGYLALAARMLSSEDPRWCSAWNFGPRPGDECTVAELVERLCRAWGNGSWQEVGPGDERHEAFTLRLAIDKAVSKLGWRPRWGLDETAARTACWYRRYYENPARSMRDASLADIRAYGETSAQVHT